MVTHQRSGLVLYLLGLVCIGAVLLGSCSSTRPVQGMRPIAAPPQEPASPSVEEPASPADRDSPNKGDETSEPDPAEAAPPPKADNADAQTRPKAESGRRSTTSKRTTDTSSSGAPQTDPTNADKNPKGADPSEADPEPDPAGVAAPAEQVLQFDGENWINEAGELVLEGTGTLPAGTSIVVTGVDGTLKVSEVRVGVGPDGQGGVLLAPQDITVDLLASLFGDRNAVAVPSSSQQGPTVDAQEIDTENETASPGQSDPARIDPAAASGPETTQTTGGSEISVTDEAKPGTVFAEPNEAQTTTNQVEEDPSVVESLVPNESPTTDVAPGPETDTPASPNEPVAEDPAEPTPAAGAAPTQVDTRTEPDISGEAVVEIGADLPRT